MCCTLLLLLLVLPSAGRDQIRPGRKRLVQRMRPTALLRVDEGACDERTSDDD
jgi:hypothetical protein